MQPSDEMHQRKRLLVDSLEDMRHACRKRDSADALDELRRLEQRVVQTFDGLDSVRAALTCEDACADTRDHEGASKPAPGAKPGSRDPRREIERLRDDLRAARSTCGILEDEVRHLETKALDAIAEAGELRRRIDLMERSTAGGAENSARNSHADVYRERARLVRRIHEAEEDRRLLMRALGDSEQEISRLTRALDLAVRKLRVA